VALGPASACACARCHPAAPAARRAAAQRADTPCTLARSRQPPTPAPPPPPPPPPAGGSSPDITPKAASTSSSGAARTTATLTAAGKASPDAAAAAAKSKADVTVTPVIECKPDADDADAGSPEHGHVHLGCGGHHHHQPAGQAGAPGAVDPARQAYIGLLIHSVADGLAVGAASLSSNLAVGFTVAAAMVLHKGPVAFGLTLYLQAAAWDATKRHQALLLFAAMSPVTAVVTYVLFGQLPGVTSQLNVALCVLFSGGTFLYAACIHIFPSIIASSGMVPNRQLPALLAGAALPLFLSTLVPHHH
jgi:zinc transporter ZupT